MKRGGQAALVESIKLNEGAEGKKEEESLCLPWFR